VNSASAEPDQPAQPTMLGPQHIHASSSVCPDRGSSNQITDSYSFGKIPESLRPVCSAMANHR
jgi:hypothetical protein